MAMALACLAATVRRVSAESKPGWLAVSLISGLTACSGTLDAGWDRPDGQSPVSQGNPTSDVVVNLSDVHQTMDGFGAADVWEGPRDQTQLTLFFDPVNGIGLSLLRIGIEQDGTLMGSAGISDGQAITEFGGKVWAAPWSPLVAFKASGEPACTDASTCYLFTSNYDAWASTLAAFPALYESQSGVRLYGISAQDAPDSCSSSYNGCLFSYSQMVSFVKVLGPKLHALSPQVKLLAAESNTWANCWSYGNAILDDPAASSAVDIIATHDFGASGLTRPSPPAGNTHAVWETSASDGGGGDIGTAIGDAQAIYAAVTTGGASAWHYWWFSQLLSGGDENNPPKRVYALGNFSKFVRPGYQYVGTTGLVPSGVQLTAFKNPSDGTVVVVVINSNSSATSLSLAISGGAPSTMIPWVTSSSDNLVSKTGVSVSGSRFTFLLDALSVTTFVSQ
jgi:glucuronoarabinoxylan endo-1,4-beta-xylanase